MVEDPKFQSDGGGTMTASSSCNLFAPNYKPQSVNPNTKSIHNLKGEITMEPSQVIQMCNLDSNDIQSDQTQVATTGFHLGVPIGIYLAKVVTAFRKSHPDTNHDIIRIALEIQSPEESGHVLTKYFNLTTKEAVSFFKREMKGIGFPIENWNDIDIVLSLLPDTVVNAEVSSHSSGNQVVYLKAVNNKKKVPKVDPEKLWE